MAIANTPTGIQIIGSGSAVAGAVGAPKGTARLGLARDGWSVGVSEGGLEPPRPMRALGPQPPKRRSPGLLRVYQCCSGRP
jgi:hypothetical protein